MISGSVNLVMAVGCVAAYPEYCQGIITESAQTFVEVATLDGIRQAERQFVEPQQLARLRKHHADNTHWVLHAWVDTWLSDAFSHWNLDTQLRLVCCPALALHGDRDGHRSSTTN